MNETRETTLSVCIFKDDDIVHYSEYDFLYFCFCSENSISGKDPPGSMSGTPV